MEIRDKIKQIKFEREFGEIIRNIKEYIKLVEWCKEHTFLKNRYYVSTVSSIIEFKFKYEFEYKKDIVYLFYNLKQEGRYYYYNWNCTQSFLHL
jgi:hypothetical protein